MNMTTPRHLGLNRKDTAMSIYEDLDTLASLSVHEAQSVAAYLLGHDPALFVAAVQYARSISAVGRLHAPVEDEPVQRCTYDNHLGVMVEGPDYEVGLAAIAYCDHCEALLQIVSDFDGETVTFNYVGEPLEG